MNEFDAVMVFLTRWFGAVVWLTAALFSFRAHRKVARILRIYYGAQALVGLAWTVLFVVFATTHAPPSPILAALSRVGHYFLAVLVIYNAWLAVKMTEHDGRLSKVSGER